MIRGSGRVEVFLAVLSSSCLFAACSETTLPHQGSRSFGRELALEDTAVTSAGIGIGDVNADGHQDILLVRGRHWPLEDLVLLGNGSGSFDEPYAIGAVADRSYSGVLADVDDDGDLDVVVSNDAPDPKVVHLNNGQGQFAVGSTFGRGEWTTRYVSVADLDGDGRLDVVLANRYGRQAGPSYVCFGVEGGRFADDCNVVSEGSATTITVGDFNGDAVPDLVVPHRDGGQSFVYLNDGDASFGERRPFGPPEANIRSAEPADLDGDGLMDLAAIDEATGAAIFWGQSDVSFSPGEPLGPSDVTPYAITISDLDRNGRPDVIIGYVESQPVVFFNDGPDIFMAVPFGDAQGAAYAFSVGDLDEDGFLDIAMARSGAPNVLYFGAP